MRRAVPLLVALLTCVPAPAAAEELPLSEPGELVVSPDGRHLYAAGMNATLTFAHDPQTGALTELADLEPGGEAIAISPDGTTVYVGGRESLHVLRRDPGTGLLLHVHTYVHGEDRSYGLQSVEGIEVSPDGRQVYVLPGRDHALFTFDRDPATGLLWPRDARAGPATQGPTDLAASPDGSTLYVAGEGGVGIFRRDAQTGSLSAGELVENPYNMVHQAVAVTPDGGTVLAGLATYTAYRRAADGGLSDARHVDTHGGNCMGCGYGTAILAAPGGDVYAADWDRAAINHVRFAGDGSARVAEPAPGGQTRRLALTPDARFVHATVGASGATAPTAIASFRRDPQDGRLDGVAVTPLTVEIPDRPQDMRVASAGVTINDGALYTNSREVTVSFTIPWGFASLRLAGDGGLAAGTLIRARRDNRYPFTLDDGPAERTVRRIYALPTRTVAGARFETLTDDIVLDQRPPVVQSASVEGRVLTLRARDERSGVRGLQLARRRSAPGPLRRFRRRVRIARATGPLLVRVQDGAGNPSRWRAARRR